MSLFSNSKCPIHRIEYKIGKNYMCQEHYFCPKCKQEKHKRNQEVKHIKEMEERLRKLEKSIEK